MATIFEKERRARSDPMVKNMGCIYWQNTVDWQTPSWATLDYTGNWKMSHNMVGRTFNEVLLTSNIETNTTTGEKIFNVYIVNDGLNVLENAEIFIQQF